LGEISNGTLVDNIKLVLSDTLQSRKTLRRCLLPDQIIKRAWDTLKVRGFIKPEAPVPIVNHSSVTVEILLQTALIFSHSDKVSEYKKAQIFKLYQTLDDKLIENFRNFIMKDSLLFGYDDRPTYIFKYRKSFQKKNSSTLYNK